MSQSLKNEVLKADQERIAWPEEQREWRRSLVQEILLALVK